MADPIALGDCLRGNDLDGLGYFFWDKFTSFSTCVNWDDVFFDWIIGAITLEHDALMPGFWCK